MDLLPFIIAGLATGSVYGLAGVGLVLTYKTSGIFNFAHGSLATVSAFLFYTLYVQHGLPWGVAALVAVVVAGPLLGLVLELLGRVLARSTLTVQVVGTIGILLIVEAGVLIIYGSEAVREVPQYLPTNTVQIFGTPVTVATILIFAISLVLTVVLNIYFRVARNGVAMRAVVDNADLLDLAGTGPTRVRRLAWMIGVTFVALSGVLLAPLLSDIDASDLTLLVVTAFGAAAIGAFTNIPLTFVGGLLIGVASALASKYFNTGFLGGLPPALPFLILFAYLVVMPRRRVQAMTRVALPQARTWRAPPLVQISGSLILLVALAFVPAFAGDQIEAWMTMLTNVILFLSLGLLVRMSGQVSLCQISFMAIGVSAFSHLTTGSHLPWLAALLLSGLIAVPIGAVLAIPAIRLSGLYLALATLGFGILLNDLFYTENYMFGSSGLGLTVPRPSLWGLSFQGNNVYYYLILAICVLVAVLVYLLGQGRLGRLLSALSSSPTGLTSTGLSVTVTLVVVFCLSAFLAAIAGALAGGVVGVASGTTYSPLLSVTYFALIIIAVGEDPWYAVIAAAGITLIPTYWTSSNTTNYLTLLFGVMAVLYCLTPAKSRQLPAAARRFIDKARLSRVRHPRQAESETPLPYPAAARVSGTELAVKSLRVQFGGLVAVDKVTLRVTPGQITRLIGPNGAGKTTTFNACTGLVQARLGNIALGGKDLTRQGPARRARIGIGRTFQQMELFDNLTVAENVAMGREGGVAGSSPIRQILSSRKERESISRATIAALQTCDLTGLSNEPISSLSTGQRRMVELARCLAGEFSVLLLDEPSSGLDSNETLAFGSILKQVAHDSGVGILLVEHDMALVNAVCDYAYVLDFGELICEGPIVDVMRSPIVRDVYLGSSEIDGSASGHLSSSDSRPDGTPDPTMVTN